MVSPASGSEAVSDPTTALVPAFSATEKVAAATVGTSFALVTLIVYEVTTAVPLESVIRTPMPCVVAAS